MDNDAVYTPAARSFGAPQAPQTVTQTYVHVLVVVKGMSHPVPLDQQ